MQQTSGGRTAYVSGAIDSLPDINTIEREYEECDAWGLVASIDLHHCNPKRIRDADEIKRFVVELCDQIGMKRFGDCMVVNFGEDERVAGYSMTQLIETSLISGHFANATNAAYLDIFSCKCYSPRKVAQFAQDFFQAEDFLMSYAFRR